MIDLKAPGTLAGVEKAIERREIWAAITHGRYWRIRRNGKTQTWKTRPTEFRIPFKSGMYNYGQLTQTSRISFLSDDDWRNADFVIANEDPNDRSV